MKVIKELAEKIGKTSLINTAKQLERNSVYLRGFILTKPLFKCNDKLVAFDIVMIHKTQRGITYQTYSCNSHATNIIEKLKKLNVVAYVQVHGSLRQLRKANAMPMITTMKIHTMTEFPLIRKEKQDGK